MAESEDTEVEDSDMPVCVGCMRSLDPLNYYCPNCGEETGQLTQFIPHINTRWTTIILGRMRRKLETRDVSISGRLSRFFVIVWYSPVLLIGLFFKKGGFNSQSDENLFPNRPEGPAD